ncbi:hypothetical protein Tco_0348105 [Tanacetum coccineum]
MDSTLAVPMFQQGEDPIECTNKEMAFLSAVVSRFPQSNNQLRMSSNPRNQATIQDGREVSQILDEEQLAFLADLKINEALVAQQTIPQNSAFQIEYLDTYDSTKVVLMVNLSRCDSDVRSKVPYTDSYPNDILNQEYKKKNKQDESIQDTNSSSPNDLLVLSLVKQMTNQVANLDKENQINKMVNESLIAELERYKERVTIFEQRINEDLNNREKLIDSQMDDLILKRNTKFATLQQEIDTLKETFSNNVTEKESLSKTLTVFKTKAKEKESKYIDKEIILEKQNKELENNICKMYRSAQAMYMLTKPQVFYDDTHKQALGYQNPCYLKKA